MPTIICVKCGAGVEVERLQGDYSIYVCQDCAEKANQEAYKAELKALMEKEARTESENRRIEFLKSKII